MQPWRFSRRSFLAGGTALSALLAKPLHALAAYGGEHGAGNSLETGFRNPPPEARLRCYWWWLNGNTDVQTITRDLEAMKANGYGGAILVDAGGADQRGNHPVPAGPTFGSAEWRVLFRHALKEADRLGLVISLSIQSGWNLGGPMVQPRDAAKIITWSRLSVAGPARIHQTLPEPPQRQGFSREIAVLALPLRHGTPLPGAPGSSRRAIPLLEFKTASKEYGMSAPNPAPLLRSDEGKPGDEDALASEVRDLTAQFGANGVLEWQAPAGQWEILRIGYTISGALVSTSSGKWQGLVIDYMDRAAFETYWREVVDPLMADAKPYLGRTLKYLVTDSWELGGINWTPGFREEFRARRGYDLLSYLPVMTGRIIEDRATSGYFLNDLRRTVADLIAQNHYGAFAEHARTLGLGIHPESGGPHGAPIDALQLLGLDALPQTEFWAVNAHRPTDQDRFFVKEASSAAHIYGKKLVAAEGMSSIGPQWEERICNDLKPTFDQALCAGLNLLFWHTFTSSPAKYGLPGQEYFAGTHFNPNVTWWKVSAGWIAYINRCQFLMQQGLPVSDVLYYYGDEVPNFVRVKSDDPAKVLPGYDYDVIDEDALVHRLDVRNGNLVLPEGVAYRVLVLPAIPLISLRALRKTERLIEQGATVIGPKPVHTTGIDTSSGEMARLAERLWGPCDGTTVREHRYGKGRVVCGKTAREVLAEEHVLADFEFSAAHPEASMDFVHRRTPSADIYFIRNARPHPETAQITVRVSGKQPELWFADTGKVLRPAVFDVTPDGRTRMPLTLEPYGSVFLVLRQPAGPHVTRLTRDGALLFPASTPPDDFPVVWRAHDTVRIESARAGHYEAAAADGAQLTATFQDPAWQQEAKGTWEVRFTPGWGAPESTRFESLTSWTANADPRIRYYSGTATYSTEVEISPAWLRAGRRLEIDLGEVREIAEVTLNGLPLGTLWKPPFRVDVTAAAKPGRNHLQVGVTNLWPNRLIGDEQPGVAHRLTYTNIRKFTRDSPLLPSGLLGPVTLISTESQSAELGER
jgi:hypothetical protein